MKGKNIIKAIGFKLGAEEYDQTVNLINYDWSHLFMVSN